MTKPDLMNDSIELEAQKKANEKVSELFKESKIDNWLANNRGGTYTRIQLELKLAAQRMFKYEYLVDYNRHRIYSIEQQRDELASEIGGLKAGLYVWELKDQWLHQFSKNPKFTWRAFREQITCLLNTLWGVFFQLFELILKSGLAFIVIISLLGMTGIIENINDISLALNEPSKQFVVIGTIFAGISLIHFLSTSIYYDFLFSQKDLGQSGRGFFRRLVRRRFYNKPNPPSFPLFERIHRFFWGNSQISGRIVKVLDWQFTHREIFLLFIFLAESLLGYEGIIRLYKAPNENGDFVTPELWDHLAIGFSSGIYALVNIAFAIAKAKRTAVMLSRQEKYLALVEQKKSLILAIQDCHDVISRLNQEYKRYKEEYETLLHETGGILAQIDLLSIDAYQDERGKIE